MRKGKTKNNTHMLNTLNICNTTCVLKSIFGDVEVEGDDCERFGMREVVFGGGGGL